MKRATYNQPRAKSGEDESKPTSFLVLLVGVFVMTCFVLVSGISSVGNISRKNVMCIAKTTVKVVARFGNSLGLNKFLEVVITPVEGNDVIGNALDDDILG